jgi:NADPH-dependent ferric siderophore reductase
MPIITRIRAHRVERISPSFVRIEFAGTGLAEFGTDGPAYDQRLKLIFPPTSGTLPELGADTWYADLLALPEDARGWIRTYTLRELRGDGVVIDFVLHPGAHGPGSDWAATAVPGDEVLIVGPKRGEAGGGVEWAPGKASRLLLVGDETAVPAVASILRSLPADAVGTAILEVPVAADVQRLRAPAGIEVTWLPRAGAPVGSRAIETVADLLGFDPPRAETPDFDEVDPDLWETPSFSSSGEPVEPGAPDDGRYAWIAGESTMVTVLRRHLVGELAMPRRQVAFMGYWRQGVAMKG